MTAVKGAIDLAKAGADILGLVFDPNSKSNVPLAEAVEISKNIHIYRTSDPSCLYPRPSAPSSMSAPWFTAQKRNLQSTGIRPLLVGIFRSQTLSEILLTTAVAKLDLVELEETVPASWARHIPVPVIRRFRPESRDIAHPGLHSFCLIYQDAASADFDVAKALVAKGEAHKWPLPIILADD